MSLVPQSLIVPQKLEGRGMCVHRSCSGKGMWWRGEWYLLLLSSRVSAHADGKKTLEPGPVEDASENPLGHQWNNWCRNQDRPRERVSLRDEQYCCRNERVPGSLPTSSTVSLSFEDPRTKDLAKRASSGQGKGNPLNHSVSHPQGKFLTIILNLMAHCSFQNAFEYNICFTSRATLQS